MHERCSEIISLLSKQGLCFGLWAWRRGHDCALSSRMIVLPHPTCVTIFLKASNKWHSYADENYVRNLVLSNSSGMGSISVCIRCAQNEKWIWSEEKP